MPNQVSPLKAFLAYAQLVVVAVLLVLVVVAVVVGDAKAGNNKKNQNAQAIGINVAWPLFKLRFGVCV